MDMTSKDHWEKVFREKQPHQMSWWQSRPATSLDFIHSLDLPKNAELIDVGGGDSKLVDYLLQEGFEKITVLDISTEAIARAKARLGTLSDRVRWVVTDVCEFKPDRQFDLWHDRATFHFLTSANSVGQYVAIARRSVRPGGHLIMATFSTAGPKSCSGLPVHQYSEPSLESALGKDFKKIHCTTEDHNTPFETTQNFLFCIFRRNDDAK